MIFEERYKLSELVDGRNTFYDIALEQRWKDILPGVYNDGILSVCGDNYGIDTLKGWEWMIGKNCLIIAYFCWGDFVYVSFDKKKVYLMISQEAEQISLGDNLESVFDYNFSTDKFYSTIMLCEKFNKCRELHGDLKYNQCYIPNPWICLGGEDILENYKIRNFSIYVDLIGQHWEANF